VTHDPQPIATADGSLVALDRARERLRAAVCACAADPSRDPPAAVRGGPDDALEAAVRHYATCARAAAVPPDEFVADFEALFAGECGARAERSQARERWYRALHWAVFTYVARDRP
jgi:hypothetical protein